DVCSSDLIQGRRRGRGLRNPRGGGAYRDAVVDGLKNLFTGNARHLIVGTLFKGKPAERWGRKTSGLRGFMGSLTIAGLPVEIRLEAYLGPDGLCSRTASLKFSLLSVFRGEAHGIQSQSLAGCGCIGRLSSAASRAARKALRGNPGHPRQP